MVSPRLEKICEGNPPGGGHFSVEYEWGTRGQEEGEGSNRDRWENRIPRHHVVEAAEQLLREEVRVLRLAPGRRGREQ